MEKQVSFWKTSIAYGIYYGIVAILLTVILYVTNSLFESYVNWISYALMIIFVILAQLAYKKRNLGYMSVGQGVLVGMFTVVIGALLSGIFTALLYNVIDPSILDQLKITMEEKMMQKGLPAEQIETGVGMASKFQSSPIMLILISVVGGFLFGAIISVITALFLKKTPKEDF